MLADKPLFKKYIGSKLTDAELGLDGNPESFTHPKEKIEVAIARSRAELPKKIRYKLKIDDMYSILGEAIQIEKLSSFRSFQDFDGNFRRALIELNYLEK